VPHLFALQGDIDNLPIRDLALTLLMVEGERRPDILRQRICAGVKLAYDMQRKLYSGKRKVSALITVKRPGRQNPDVECVFSSIFRECIMHNRKLRHGLYKNLLGLFELGDNSNDESITASGRQLFLGAKVNHQPKDLDLLSFVSQVLAHLPFNTVNDPLFIIYHISSIITLQGQQCIERFSSFLRPFGLTGDDDLDDTNMSEDTLERAASSKFPSRSHGASVLNSKDFDLFEFSNLCHESASLCLLLRLKSYLCTCYQLSLTRCLEYDPLAKERLCDRGALRITVSNPFDASITETLLHTSQDSNRKLDKDALVRQYAEFRCRMREEHCLVPDDASCDKSEGEDFVEVEETIPDTFGGGFEPDASDEKSDLNVSDRRSSSRMVKESKQSNNRKRRSKS
jgi:cohesin loading factor subunit SCC2